MCGCCDKCLWEDLADDDDDDDGEYIAWVLHGV